MWSIRVKRKRNGNFTGGGVTKIGIVNFAKIGPCISPHMITRMVKVKIVR